MDSSVQFWLMLLIWSTNHMFKNSLDFDNVERKKKKNCMNFIMEVSLLYLVSYPESESWCFRKICWNIFFQGITARKCFCLAFKAIYERFKRKEECGLVIYLKEAAFGRKKWPCASRRCSQGKGNVFQV